MDTNIQVGIRVRPLIDREIQAQLKLLWKSDKNRIYNQDREYHFDCVFGQPSDTASVYDVMGKPLVDKAMEGFNGTLFAYGQTASGKTHTIMGDSREPGIVPLAIQDVFNNINETPNREFLLRASYIEIYNEEITDLLSNKKGLKIRNNVENEIIIDQLMEVAITSYEEVMELIQKGIRHRKIGTTNMNERSSRSHVIFRLVIESRQLPDEFNVSECDGAVIVSHLNLVDLAGSERVAQTGAQGIRLKESGFINTSLMTLGLVIRKLSENDGHVPYRDSKLTRILQNSLGGNARTSIICTVSPVVLDETDQTLKFAGRAKNVKNKPKINEVLDGDTMLKRQTREIRDLKRKIRELEDCNLQENILLEKDKMHVQQQKIEEQQNRISKLLKEIVCSGRADSKQLPSKARRQTWCPGGLSALRSFTHESNKTGFSTSFNNGCKLNAIDEESFENDGDLDTTEAFEFLEYKLLKKEYDDFKANTCTPEQYDVITKNISQKEMECEALKNRVRDLQSECERIRSANTSQDAVEWQRAMELTLEQKVEENYQLKKDHENLSMENKTLLENIGDLNEKILSSNKQVQEIQSKCQQLQEQQENMISVEYLEKLKEEVFLKSKELEEESKKTVVENQELKHTLEANQLKYDEMVKQSECHEKEVVALKTQVEALQEECQGLREQTLRNENTSFEMNEAILRKDEIIQLQSQKSELQTQNAQLLESMESLNEKILNTDDEFAKLTSKYEGLLAEQEKMVSVEYLDQLKAEVFKKSSELEQMNKNCTAENEQLKEVMEEQRKDFLQQIEVLNQRVLEKDLEMENTNKVFEQQLGTVSEDKLQLDSVKETLHHFFGSENVNNMKCLLDEFMTSQNMNKEKIAALEEQISSHNRDTAQWTEAVAKTTEELELVKTASSEKDNTILNFQKQLADLQKDMMVVEQNMLPQIKDDSEMYSEKAINEDCEEQSAFNLQKSLTEEIERLKDSLTEKNNQYDDAREQIAKLKEDLENVSSDVSCGNLINTETSVNQMNQLNDELKSVCEQNKILNEDCTSWKNKLASAETQIQELLRQSVEMNLVVDGLNELKNTNKELLNQIESLSIAKSELENQVQLLTKSHQKEVVEDDMADKIHQLEFELETLTAERDGFITTANNDTAHYENVIAELTCDNQEKCKEIVQLKELVNKKDTDGNYMLKFEEISCLNEKLQQQLSELRHEHKTLQSALDISDEESMPVLERLRMIKDEHDKLLAETRDLLTKNDCLGNEVACMKEELEEKNCTIETLRNDGKQREDLLSKENLKLTSELDSMKESLKEVQSEEMEKLKSDVDCVTCERDTLKERLAESESIYQKQLAAEKRSLEADIATLKDVIESQESEAVVLQNAFEKKCKDHLELSQRLELLDQELNSIRETNKCLMTEMSTFKTETESILSEKISVGQEMSSLEEQLRAKENEIAELKCQLETLRSSELQGQKLEEELKKKEALVSEQMLENLNLENKVTETQKILQEKLEELVTCQSEKEEFGNCLERERAEFEQLKSEYETINARVNHTLKEKEELEDSIQACKQELAASENAMKIQKDCYAEQSRIQSDLRKSLEDDVNTHRQQLVTMQEEKLAADQKYETMLQSHEDNVEKLKKALDDVNELREQLNEARIQNSTLEKKIEVEKSNFSEQKELSKLAYERRSGQSEAQSLELVSSLKKLQAENTRITVENTQYMEQIENVKCEYDDVRSKLEEERLNHNEVVGSLTTEMSKLTENNEELEKQKKSLSSDLREKEKTNQTLTEENGALLRKLKELQTSVPNTSTQSDKPSNTDLTEKLSRLEYRLKLRQEDLVVYGDRIKEQDAKIAQFKAKEEMYKDKINKMTTTLREMRRPSADASLVEWEKVMTELQDTTMNYKKENERLEEKNKDLVAKNADLMRNLHIASIRLEKAEREVKEVESKDDELVTLRRDVEDKEKEIKRITEGLKKAFAKMNNSETKRKESESDYECQMKKKDAEIQKISDGLTIAFDKYKHYKGAWQANNQELQKLKVSLSQEAQKCNQLQKKLDDIEKKLRTSSKDESLNISSVQKENIDFASNVSMPLVNDLKNKDVTDKSIVDTVMSLRGNTSNVVVANSEKESSEKIEILDRKRKSESPHEGNMRRCKVQLEQSTSRKSGENECNQQ